MNASEIISRVSGLDFKAMGPFLVADFGNQPDSIFSALPVGEHGMETVRQGEKTQSHDHEFLSFYKSTGLDVECGGKRFSLPTKALTLVLPGLQHSWVPKQDGGSVGSVDLRHQKQVILAA